jgi:hypothetical protein
VTAEEFLATRLGTQVPDETLDWWLTELWCQAVQNASSYDSIGDGSEDLLNMPGERWRAYMDRISVPAVRRAPALAVV